MDTDETSDDVVRSLPGDIAHLPGGYHEQRWRGCGVVLCECAGCVADRKQQDVAAFVAANEDWREFARGWSGL